MRWKKKRKILAILFSVALLGAQTPMAPGKESAYARETSSILKENQTERTETTETEERTKVSTEKKAEEKTTEEKKPEEKTTEVKTAEEQAEGTQTGSETNSSTEKKAEEKTTEEKTTEEEATQKKTTQKKTTEENTEETEVAEETSGSDAKIKTDGVAPDEAVTSVQAMIDALPSVEEVEKMTQEEQKEIYNDAQDAADAYFDLSEEQQEQVELAKLMDLMDYFNGQVSMMASSGNGWMLSDDGVLTITSSEGLGDFRQNTSIKRVIIKAGVEGSIGGYAFYLCTNLTSVTIEEGANITSIGASAFRNCTSLMSITIPESVTSIGEWAFYECTSLMSITIPEGTNITSIGASAFRNCTSLMSITIEEGATIGSIGNYAFYGCGLTSVTIEKGATIGSIGIGAFLICNSLTEVTLPATAPTTVDTTSFYGLWNQINFIIPETSIGSGEGQYNLTETPWNQIVMLNGSRLIRSVAVTLMPVGGSVLPAEASCTTTGVESSEVSWTSNGSPVEDDAKAGYGESYTAEITLTAVTSTGTSDTSQSYRFVDGISATLNEAAVTATVSDSGKTLKISKTYQMPKQSQSSPDISINYQDETLNTTADMEYSTDEGGSWSDCKADMKATALGWDGTAKSVQIRRKETTDKYASESTEVTIPARPALTISQPSGSTTASSLTVRVSVSGIPEGISAEVQYQLVADGGSIDSGKWQEFGEFTNLKAGTAYTAYAKCGATESSFASDNSSQQVSTLVAAYTVSIPSATLTAGDSASKAVISVDISDGKSFDLGYRGQVQVKVKSGGDVSAEGRLKLTRQNASDTLTSAMYVNKSAFTDITGPVATFTMENYSLETAKATVSFGEPAGLQTVIPAGTYKGTVIFEVSYSEQEGGTE